MADLHQVSLSVWGPVPSDPRLPCSRPEKFRRLLNLVITRGTPPRLEGCRPASRGLMLTLMTGLQLIATRGGRASRLFGVFACSAPAGLEHVRIGRHMEVSDASLRTKVTGQ
ncbi:hypothetical protein GCM10009632_13800 [Mycolicibacterium alvei]|uniref:Uncharacterized protein n=1 Tax=Mycolicibacterium alvei TaxID=67081 RepID=A0A6N4UQG0_9MYCO|nr:hypothetical protein MALV_22350 [Mycolicibacterium alvei]